MHRAGRGRARRGGASCPSPARRTEFHLQDERRLRSLLYDTKQTAGRQRGARGRLRANAPTGLAGERVPAGSSSRGNPAQNWMLTANPRYLHRSGAGAQLYESVMESALGGGWHAGHICSKGWAQVYLLRPIAASPAPAPRGREWRADGHGNRPGRQKAWRLSGEPRAGAGVRERERDGRAAGSHPNFFRDPRFGRSWPEGAGASRPDPGARSVKPSERLGT